MHAAWLGMHFQLLGLLALLLLVNFVCHLSECRGKCKCWLGMEKCFKANVAFVLFQAIVNPDHENTTFLLQVFIKLTNYFLKSWGLLKLIKMHSDYYKPLPLLIYLHWETVTDGCTEVWWSSWIASRAGWGHSVFVLCLFFFISQSIKVLVNP